MWTSRLFWRLFLLCVGLNLLFATAVLLVVSHYQEALIRGLIEDRLYDTAVMLRGTLAGQFDNKKRDPTVLEPLIAALGKQAGVRLTLIAHDGVVLADSERDPQTMENHANRPEVRQAAVAGRGTAERISPTLGIAMCYVALPVTAQGTGIGYVRAAMPLDAIDQVAASTRRPLWLLAAAMGLISALLIWAVVGRAIQPLPQLKQAAEAVEAGRPAQHLPAEHHTELGALSAAFNRMQEELTSRAEQFQRYGKRLATVLSSMDEGIVVVDQDERVVLANDAAKRFLGISAAAIDGEPLGAVCPTRAVRDTIRQALESGETQKTEFDVHAGTRQIIALRATRLRGDPGAVAVLRDLTELRALENLRREFVGNVSHELKTPLTAIKAYAETLRLGAIHDPEHNAQFVQRIEDQAERLHQLITDLLTLARVESGRQTLQITELPLHSIIMSCLTQHQDTAAGKHIGLHAEPPAQPVAVRADEEGLLTVLNNLIDNAVKYTPEGGTIRVRWWGEDGDAVLEVEDTGIGIAPTDQERVFERFYRVDKARSRELGGTGLGLSIVKHLTLALGGSVELTSQLGVGSTFRIRLPRA